MDYAAVLRRTWDITWRYKGLWILGILAGCGGGNGGGGGGGNASSGMNFGRDSRDVPPELRRFVFSLENFFKSIDEAVIIAIAIAVVLFAILLGIIFFLIGIAGTAGLIHGFDRADEGEPVTLSSAFRGGLQYFLPLLGIRLLLFLLVLVVVLVLLAGYLAFGIATLGLGLICLLPLLCLLIPIAIAFGIYVQLMEVSIVVESSDIPAAFRNAWETLKANVISVLVMALIFFFGGGIVGLLTAAPLILLLIPVLGGIAVGSGASIGVGVGLAVLGFLVYLPIAIVIGGILQTYIQGGWTVTYRRLTGREGSAELGTSGA
jgi:hypothetical protein